MDQAGLLGSLLTIGVTIFVAELTDKDALLILALATKTKPLSVFAAGAIAFSITTAIIVSVGSVMVNFVPIFWVKVSGGVIMLGYAVWQYRKGAGLEEGLERKEEKLVEQSRKKSALWALLVMIFALATLDLAGDATEVVIVVFVAQFNNALLVFTGAVSALVAATALETAIGNRLGEILSAERIRYLSIAVFLMIGTIIILTSLLPT